MWRIAKRYNVDFFKVLELNKHFKNQHLIHPKDEVEMPDGSTGSETNQNSSEDNIEENNKETNQENNSTQAQEVLNLFEPH